MRTDDAKIWYIGDSRLMECQLHMDPPDEKAFNGNPQDILDHVINPERVIITAPGQEYKIY